MSAMRGMWSMLVVALVAMLTPKDIGYRMELAEPVAVVTEASIAPRFDEVRGKSKSVKAHLAIGGKSRRH